MLRIASVGAVVAGLILVVSAAAQVGSGKIAFADDAGIYTIDPGGSGQTLLRAGTASRLGGWSPDGSKVAFTAYDTAASNYRLIVMNANGTGEHVVAGGQIALGRHPWSSDGVRVAWGPLPNTAGNIYTASAAGGDIRQVTSDGRVKDPPEWSPDGSLLAFSERVADVPFRTELFVVAADGTGAPRQITQSGPGSNYQPTWSPDSGSIAFTTPANPMGAISVVRADGTELRRIVPTGYGSPRDPAWSPDGTKIVFATSKNSGPSRYGFAGREIYVVDADGSHEKRLTDLAPFSRSDSTPIWSPDGNRILFTRAFGPGAGWTMNPDGTCEEPLSANRMDGASWQPLLGAPPLGEQRCHAIAVEETASPYGRYFEAFVVTLANDGTEPLTNVILDTTVQNDVSLIGAQLGTNPQACSFASRHIRCSAANLSRGERVQAFITVAARRVALDRRSANLALRTAFKVSTAEQVLPTPTEAVELRFRLSRCTTDTRGRGRIDGTRFDDRICGRQGPDEIHPGQGNDAVTAGAGNDVIFARDGNLDRISCGPGRDIVVADRRDRVARDCERVRRR